MSSKHSLSSRGLSHPAHYNDQGFTLIEALVALAILGMSMVALMASFSWSLQWATQNERKMNARVLAESLLADASALPDPQLREKSGFTEDGFSWQIRAVPYTNDGSINFSPSAAAMVGVRVTWGEGKTTGSLSLTTLSIRSRDSAP